MAVMNVKRRGQTRNGLAEESFESESAALKKTISRELSRHKSSLEPIEALRKRLHKELKDLDLSRLLSEMRD